MINLKILEKNLDIFTEKMKARGLNESLLGEVLKTWKSSKALLQELESLQEKQNAGSKELGKLTGQAKEALLSELASNKAKIASLKERQNAAAASLEELSHSLPNIIDDEVPLGLNEDDNLELERVLEPKSFAFTPKEHFDLELGIDIERGVKLAKSRFTSLFGQAALLARALSNYMIDFNRSKGFELVAVPFLVSSKTLFGTGQLPKFKDDLYKLENEDLYLIPTSEVPVTNLYSGEILQESALPILHTCASSCFRSEAGSAGRDTRGILRQHQFEKVELVAITKPEESDAIFERMVSCASDLLASLELPHRKMLLCSGDIGFGAAKTIDLEVWLPGQGKYREISSISNCRDFQARRAGIRYKNEKGKNSLVHTLNGSSLAVGRTLIAVAENHQRDDGKIDIPEVLKPYM